MWFVYKTQCKRGRTVEACRAASAAWAGAAATARGSDRLTSAGEHALPPVRSWLASRHSRVPQSPQSPRPRLAVAGASCRRDDSGTINSVDVSVIVLGGHRRCVSLADATNRRGACRIHIVPALYPHCTHVVCPLCTYCTHIVQTQE